MPKVSFDMPAEILHDIRSHVGDDRKFVSVADAIRTACRKLLDQLDEIDSSWSIEIDIVFLKICNKFGFISHHYIITQPVS